jgi:hypothetical protein
LALKLAQFFRMKVPARRAYLSFLSFLSQSAFFFRKVPTGGLISLFSHKVHSFSESAGTRFVFEARVFEDLSLLAALIRRKREDKGR